MSNGFNISEVSKLLVKCHRHCCICHRFCGTKIETDHIKPKIDGGTDNIENAIPVCFECHAEIHSYNDKHPRGRKFRQDELKQHKKQWLKICKDHPEKLINANRNSDVGPLQSLIDEMEYNKVTSSKADANDIGCLFSVKQFQRAIETGAISMLKSEIMEKLLNAYHAMETANQYINASIHHVDASNSELQAKAQTYIQKTESLISDAKEELFEFLKHEE